MSRADKCIGSWVSRAVVALLLVVSGAATAGQGHLTIDPTAIDFGSIAVDTTSPPQTVTLGNDGDADIAVALGEAVFPFSRDGGTCAEASPFTLAPGDSCTVAYVFSSDSAGPVESTVDVTADGIDAGSITLSASAYYVADIAVTIVAEPAFARAGDSIVYTITVYMADGSDGAAVTVTDALPPSLGDGAWTCVEADSSTCNSTTTSGVGDTLDNYVQLANGNSVTYTYTATVLPGDAEEIANTVSVAVDPPFTVDPVLTNNAATAITIVPLFHGDFDGDD